MSASVGREGEVGTEAARAASPPARARDERRPRATTEEALPQHLARDALRRRMLAAADALAVVVAALVSTSGQLSADLGWTIATVPVWLLLAKLVGLYDRDHRALRHLTTDELGAVVTWGSVGSALAIPLLALTPAEAPDGAEVVRLWLGVTVAAAVLRAAARALWRARTPPGRVLLVGTGPLERATRRKLELFKDIHLDVLGTVDLEDVAGGGEEDVEQRVRAACVGTLPDRVVVCSQEVRETDLADVMSVCRRRRIKLGVVPPLRGMFGTAVRLSHVAELPFVEYHTWDLSLSTQKLKRAFDVVIATAGLIVTAPLLLVAALAIALDSRGGVLYVQRRAGRGGRPFGMLKLRTMVAGAHARGSEPLPKVRDDPRVTRVGRVLRRWSLDELPQLVNVVRGDMSLVGPRPEDVALVERYPEEHRFRLGALPGMTGPMQVFGRAHLTFDERLAIEREYIENMSLGRDVHILLLTIPAVFSGRGAH